MKRRMRTLSLAGALLTLPFVVSSCREANPSGRILSVDSEGAIAGFVYLDRNGNEVPDAADDPVQGLEIHLFVAGTQSLAASANTDANGIFVLDNVPVGRHRLEPDSTFLGDSLAVFRLR